MVAVALKINQNYISALVSVINNYFNVMICIYLCRLLIRISCPFI